MGVEVVWEECQIINVKWFDICMIKVINYCKWLIIARKQMLTAVFIVQIWIALLKFHEAFS